MARKKDWEILHDLWSLNEAQPDLFPQGWDEMDSTEQLAAVQGNDSVWEALVEQEEERETNRARSGCYL